MSRDLTYFPLPKSRRMKNRILREKRLNSKFLQNHKIGKSAKRRKNLIPDRHTGTWRLQFLTELPCCYIDRKAEKN